MRSFSLIALIAALFVVNSHAQTPTPKPNNDDSGEIIKVNSRLIVVPVSVTDSSGEPVVGLKMDNFRISEDGRQAVIDQVTDAERTPLEIALLIDVSGSVNALFDFEIKAAAQFLESVMKPDDRATIFLIGDQPISAMTRGTAAEAAAKVRAIVPSGKFTAFYDTVSAASTYLQKNAPVRSRRVIIALTDGEDNWSTLTRESEVANYRNVDVNTLTPQTRNQLAERTNTSHVNAQTRVLRYLQDADTVFYVINPAGESYKLNSISKRAHTGMTRFADETGGTAFLPKLAFTGTKDPAQNAVNERKNEEALNRIFKQLASELRAQYLVQYYSESEFPANKFVKLNVTVQNATAVKTRARQGYYVKD